MFCFHPVAAIVILMPTQTIKCKCLIEKHIKLLTGNQSEVVKMFSEELKLENPQLLFHQLFWMYSLHLP